MRNRKKKNPILEVRILFFMAAAVLSAQAGNGNQAYPEIRAILTPRKATVGDLLEYRISLSGKDAKKYAVSAPDQRTFYPGEKSKTPGQKSRPSDSVPLYIIYDIKKENARSASEEKFAVVMQISFYRPGRHALPEVEIRDPRGARVAYAVPEIEITAMNTNGQPEDIEPPLDLGGNYTRLWILLAAACAAGALGYGAYRFIRDRSLSGAETVPIIPPLDVFLREVRDLRGEDLIDEGRVEDYVFGISMIFRRYLSAGLDLDATDMTSEEILRALRKTRVRYYAVADCLNLWDLAKFAEFAPSREALRANLESTVKMARRIEREKDDGIPGV